MAGVCSEVPCFLCLLGATISYLDLSRRAGKDREELLDVFGRQRPRLRDDILGRVAVGAQGP